MNISDYVKSVRKKLGLNQTDFAAVVWPTQDPKITQPLISRYENGKAVPTGINLLRIQSVDPDRKAA